MIIKRFTLEGIVMCLWCYWKDLAMGYKYTLQNNVICEPTKLYCKSCTLAHDVNQPNFIARENTTEECLNWENINCFVPTFKSFFIHFLALPIIIYLSVILANINFTSLRWTEDLQ